MRKIVVIILILLLVLLGIEGCEKQEQVSMRSSIVEFVKGKPYLGPVDRESPPALPVIRVDESFDVALKVNNYLTKPVGGFAVVSNFHREASSIWVEKDFSVDAASSEGDFIEPAESIIDFGSFVYEKEVKEGDSLSTKIILNYYDIEFFADMCFKKEEDIRECSNDASFSKSFLQGDINSPITIRNIERRIKKADEMGVDFELIIYFENVDIGSVGVIENLYISIDQGYVDCDKKIIFKNKMAEISCDGNVNFAGTHQTLRMELLFNYDYEIKKILNYKVLATKERW